MAGADGTMGKTLNYQTARLLAAGVGLGIIGVLAVLLYARRVETVEVVAVLLFLPVFLAVLKWDTIGGVVAGVLAAIVYVALRLPAIEAVGFGPFTGLVISRSFGFIIFGLIGGFANKQLRSSIDKLDLYDQIDDQTGLFNARFLLQATDLESARAKRYDSVFGVSVVDIPASWFGDLSRKKRDKVLKGLGELITSSVRTVDRAAYAFDGTSHRLAVVLPETGPEGARMFTGKLVEQLGAWLEKNDVRGAGALVPDTIAFPEDEAGLQKLRKAFEAIDEAEHPVHH